MSEKRHNLDELWGFKCSVAGRMGTRSLKSHQAECCGSAAIPTHGPFKATLLPRGEAGFGLPNGGMRSAGLRTRLRSYARLLEVDWHCVPGFGSFRDRECTTRSRSPRRDRRRFAKRGRAARVPRNGVSSASRRESNSKAYRQGSPPQDAGSALLCKEPNEREVWPRITGAANEALC